jgi:hypothetical protein
MVLTMCFKKLFAEIKKFKELFAGDGCSLVVKWGV